MNVRILPKECRVVFEEEDDKDENMAAGEEGGDEGVWMDEEDEPPDDLRYNGEGNNNLLNCPGACRRQF